MRRVFADTFYWIALTNPADPYHAMVVGYMARHIGGDYDRRAGMARNAVRLELSASEVAQLNGWQAAHGTAQQVALRCRLVLAAVEGKQDLAIATAFRVSRHTASLWRRRVHEKGIGAVWEIGKGRGRKPQLDQARRDAIIAATLETKPAGATIGVVARWPAPRA